MFPGSYKFKLSKWDKIFRTNQNLVVLHLGILCLLMLIEVAEISNGDILKTNVEETLWRVDISSICISPGMFIRKRPLEFTRVSSALTGL